MNTFFIQCIQPILLMILAPLFVGWIKQVQAWLNNKSGPGILQPYRTLRKLFLKTPLLPEKASLFFRIMPAIYLATMIFITMLIPVLSCTTLFFDTADIIVLIGIFTLSKIFVALAAMDLGTAFGSFGARREMFVAFLSEPALLIVFFNMALISHTTKLPTMTQFMLTEPLMINPSLVFSLIAFLMVLLAENSRIPIDNPNTHLELTMIHEAMILEYSGKQLALIEWASHLKLLNYFAIFIALFAPWGITLFDSLAAFLFSNMIFLGKLTISGIGIAVFEALTAKIRLYLVPQFLTSAFLLAILGVLIQLLIMRS